MAVATADFNGDGIDDLVASNASDDSVSLMLGRPNGRFSRPRRLGWHLPGGADSAYGGMVTADFNGDHRPDLAVGVIYARVMVFLNRGHGTFSRPHLVQLRTLDPWGMAAGDLNGDHRPDLVVSSFRHHVVALINRGRGRFTRVGGVFGPLFAPAIALRRLSGDQHVDLLVCDDSRGRVLEFRGNGHGGFARPVSLGSMGGPGCKSVVTADFNHDGRPDVAAGRAAVSVMLGEDGGLFAAPRTYPAGFGAGGFGALVSGDFNGDGQTDLAVSGQGVSVLLGDGAGAFTTVETFKRGTNDESELAAGNFNSDGLTDLAIGDYDAAKVFVRLASGSTASTGSQ